jgi:hypothetical protein
MRAALKLYCSIAHPEVHVVQFPLWLLWMIARAGRRIELRDALPLFRYMQRARLPDPADATEANDLLGAPTITLEEWSLQQRGAWLRLPHVPTWAGPTRHR